MLIIQKKCIFKNIINKCLNIFRHKPSVDIEEQELDKKFKRLAIPEEYKNKVSRVYAKTSESGNHYVQKPGK
jgi:hypothetical protein